VTARYLGGLRPLDPLRSIKVKLGAVVLGSVASTVAAIFVFLHIGLAGRLAFALGLVISLVVIQLLAHGMVLPLREMATATGTMARGDYSRRVTSTAQDEVGTLARSFNAMAAQLEQAEEHRLELLANVSHELRTPIAALRARLENLADGVEVLDQAAVEAMLRSTARLSGLVDQLLELSKIESGAVGIDRETVVLAKLVDAAVAETSPVRPDVTVTVDLTPDLCLAADRARLHEVLTNLLTNALRHSPPGGTVGVRGRADDTGTRLDVTDEGPGIPTEDLVRVFDRFHRVDSARSLHTGGSGLGLAIARSIVELHGGSIRAESRRPNGCRMVIDLPG
jgi:signal transduction histidine kinase